MLEDYIVRVNLPIDDTASTGAAESFVLGSTYGYNPGERAEDPIWFWDGQDIWLPPSNSGIFSTFKGTMKFIASGSALGIGPVRSDPGEALLPAIGDTLVLQLWPQDILKLIMLFPNGCTVPKYIVYQNVDRGSAIARAISLIVEHPEYRDHYRQIFTRDSDGGEITDAELRARATAWVNDEWIGGRGIGILVNSGEQIGEAAVVPSPPGGLDSDIRVAHHVPPGVDVASWRRLTLKAHSSEFIYNPLFLFYVLSQIENSDWTERPTNTGASGEFVTRTLSLVNSFYSVKISHQLRSSWSYGDRPDPDMPPALSSFVLKVKPSGFNRKLISLFDPFQAPFDQWRIQGLVEEESTHEWEFADVPLYAQVGGVDA